MSEDMIPITLFLVAGAVVIGVFYWNHRNKVTIMETVQKSIESGNQLTPELLASLGAAVNPRARDLRRGIVFVSLGVGTLLCSLFFNDTDVTSGLRAGSMFPLMLGFGFLLVWKLTRVQD
jgi:hypothetical protein